MKLKKKICNPDISYKEGQNLFKINTTPKLPKYASSIINEINGWAKGSKAENVGQVSELIKMFREEKPAGSLEDWIAYHQGLKGRTIQILKGNGKNKRLESIKMAGIDQGVADIMQKLEDVKKSIDSLTQEGIRAWLENLVYQKTYCGLEAQELILKDIAEKRQLTWILGSMEDERQGIDGYIIDPNVPKFFPLQIKSSSYSNKHKQEHFDCPIVSYDLKENGIVYTLPDNVLIEPTMSEKWKEIKDRTKARFLYKNGEIR